jgi:predicted component of type VI protein secretion system
MGLGHHCSFVGKMNWRRSGNSLHPTVHLLSLQQNCSSAASNKTTGWLVGLNGFHCGEDFRLTEGDVSLGSGWDADIILTSPEVSRTHAKIHSSNDVSTIEDCGSATGVFVNGDRTSAPRALQHGDVVKLGLGEFIFCSLDPKEEQNSIERKMLTAAAAEKKTSTRGWLVCQSGDLQGLDFRLTNGPNRIGSAANLEVSLPDPNVHANHFIIECTEERLYLRKKSADIQIVRAGILIEAGVLRDRDVIRLGAMSVMLRILS